MSIILTVFDLIFQTFSTAWQVVQAVYGSFMAIFDSFASFFDNLFANLGIYNSIITSLDAVIGISVKLSRYVEGNGFTETICSFLAMDTLFTVFLTCFSATLGVLLTALSLVLVTTIPVLIGWLAVKGVLRLVRLCSAGIVDP